MLVLTANIWAQTATAPSAGTGTAGDPYQIATLENLYWITASDAVVSSPNQAARWTKYYIQTADINASTTSGWDGGKGWAPIGNSTTKFTGTYDGQNHVISSIYINRPSGYLYIGVFSYTTNATIQNLGLTNINIVNSYWCVGALVGLNKSTSVTNCYSTGSVASTGPSGGLIGSNESSTISNCYSTANVVGYQILGGLMGSNKSTSVVSNCYSTGSVTRSAASGDAYTGGLIGENSSSTITGCYSASSVTNNFAGNIIGGLVGANSNATISNCYSTGNVSSIGANVGGLVGHSYGSTINYCYSTGSVSGLSPVGGLLGSTFSSTTSNSFWNTTTSGQVSSAGGTGKTTDEMKTNTTYTSAGWDIDTWNIGDGINNGYPYLKWQNTDGSPLPVELISFTSNVSGSQVALNWQTATEVNNFGFEIERSPKFPPTTGQAEVRCRNGTQLDLFQGVATAIQLKSIHLKMKTQFPEMSHTD